jgi:hypothetical protein
MEDLIDATASYVRKNKIDLVSSYDWELPKAIPWQSFKYGNDPLWEKNRRLRRHLSEEWKNHPDSQKRFDLAKWYVSSWGGVHGNSENTLRDYVNASPNDLKQRALKGVSSWSKILAMQNPDTYQIYDARVATAINAIQLTQGVALGVVFPIPHSQNKLIKRFRKHRTSCFDFRAGTQATYVDYLTFVSHVSSRTNFHREIVEMVLFADAEKLASVALDDEGAAFREWDQRIPRSS